MQCLVDAVLALPHIGLLGVLAVHSRQQVVVLPPHQELLDRRTLPNRYQRLYRIAFHPLVVVKLLPHGHLPDGSSLWREFGGEPVLLRVEEEVVVFGRVGLVGDPGQVETAELEALGMGNQQLVHALQELHVNGRGFRDFLAFEAEPPREGMAEGDELLFYEEAEAVESAVEGVDDELCERCDLRHPVEAVLFLQQHFLPLLQVRHHQVGGLQQLEDVVVQLAQQLEHGLLFGVGSPNPAVELVQGGQSFEPSAYHLFLALPFPCGRLIVPKVHDHNVPADLFEIGAIVLVALLVDLRPRAPPQPSAAIRVEVGQRRYPAVVPDLDALLEQGFRDVLGNDLAIISLTKYLG